MRSKQDNTLQNVRLMERGLARFTTRNEEEKKGTLLQCQHNNIGSANRNSYNETRKIKEVGLYTSHTDDTSHVQATNQTIELKVTSIRRLCLKLSLA